jgi:hypothetical protein
MFSHTAPAVDLADLLVELTNGGTAVTIHPQSSRGIVEIRLMHEGLTTCSGKGRMLDALRIASAELDQMRKARLTTT